MVTKAKASPNWEAEEAFEEEGIVGKKQAPERQGRRVLDWPGGRKNQTLAGRARTLMLREFFSGDFGRGDALQSDEGNVHEEYGYGPHSAR